MPETNPGKRGFRIVPLYEYECVSCHHRLEKIQSFREAPLRECPVCGGPLERLISPPAIQFKGSGWYVTDYARSGGSSPSKTAENKPANPASGEAASSESKTESKSAAPATSTPKNGASKSS